MNPLSKLKPLIPNISTRINHLRFFSQNLEPINPKKLPTNYDPSSFDPTNHRAPPTSRVCSLVDDVSSLTLAEVCELSQILIKKMNLTNPPNIAIMDAGGGFGSNTNASAAGVSAGKEEEKKEEKTVFELRLEGYDAASKIKVIKEVRGFTELGLKEAKELVEKAPVVIKGGVSKEDGEKIVEKMKAVGAKVVLA